jgi:hypothetical protein
MCACHPSYTETVNGRIVILVGLDIKWDASSKITRAKTTGGLAEVVEQLPNKCEVLSSNPIQPKNQFCINILYISSL